MPKTSSVLGFPCTECFRRPAAVSLSLKLLRTWPVQGEPELLALCQQNNSKGLAPRLADVAVCCGRLLCSCYLRAVTRRLSCVVTQAQAEAERETVSHCCPCAEVTGHALWSGHFVSGARKPEKEWDMLLRGCNSEGLCLFDLLRFLKFSLRTYCKTILFFKM